MRFGYSFAGWNTAADGSGTNYAEGATYTTDAALVLYARWMPVYAITYSGNNATGGTAPAAQEKEYGVPLELAQNTGNLVRDGYAFDGWNTQADGSGTAYAEGSSYTENAALSLFARWIPNGYSVSYNANGGTGSADPASQVKLHDVLLTLSDRGTMARTGYTFQGWNTQADGSGTTYTEGQLYPTNAALLLYAQWQIITYTVTYQMGLATGGSVPTQQTKTYDVNLTLAANSGSLSRTGYTFVGWDTAADGSGTDYAAGGTYTTNAALILYPRWQIIIYTVTYLSGTATGGSPPASQNKIWDVDLTLHSTAGTLTRTGYSFAGWDTAADGSGTDYAAGGTYSTNANINLYPRWLPAYTITYLSGTATSGSVPASQTKVFDQTIALASNTGNLARTGYSFAGWDTAADGSGTDYAAGGTYSTNANITLYPRWSNTVVASIRITGNLIGGGGSGVTYVWTSDASGNNRTDVGSAAVNFFEITDTTIALSPSISSATYFVIGCDCSDGTLSRAFTFFDGSANQINQLSYSDIQTSSLLKWGDADTSYYLFYYDGSTVSYTIVVP